MRVTATLIGTGALVAASVAFALPAAAADTASVSVLHGVPGATVDFCANGEELTGRSRERVHAIPGSPRTAARGACHLQLGPLTIRSW